MGFSANMRVVLQDMARHDPEGLKAHLGEERFRQVFLNGLMNRMLKNSEPALKLYAQIMGALDGTKKSVNLNLSGDLEKEAVAVAMDALGMTDEERFEACVGYVEKALLDHPERRMPVLDRLGGRFVETSETLALAGRANGGAE